MVDIMKKINLADKDVYVRAGNNQQARGYFHTKKIPYNPSKVIHNIDFFRGLRNMKIVCVGTYWELNDHSEFVAFAKICRARLLYDDY